MGVNVVVGGRVQSMLRSCEVMNWRDARGEIGAALVLPERERKEDDEVGMCAGEERRGPIAKVGISLKDVVMAFPSFGCEESCKVEDDSGLVNAGVGASVEEAEEEEVELVVVDEDVVAVNVSVEEKEGADGSVGAEVGV
jgi:hypothetical protein